MKQQPKLLLLFLFIMMLVAACGGGNAGASEDSSAAFDSGDDFAFEEAMEEEMAASEAFDGESDALDFDESGADGAGSSQVQTAQVQERLIIRNGYMTITVSDTEAVLGQISTLAESTGGWVVNSNMNLRGEHAYGDINIRVPTDQFESSLNSIRGFAVEVNSESMSGQDVTEEYVDLQSRLTNLEATADRVRSFLDETTNVEEALAVNIELSRLESDIEIIKGRMQYLSQSASFSTINVQVQPDIAAQPIEVGGWRPDGVAKESIEALVEALQWFVDLLIRIVLFLLPLLIVVALPAYLIYRGSRYLWRRFRPQRPTAPTGPETDA